MPNLAATSKTRLTPNSIQFAWFDYDFLPPSNPVDSGKVCAFPGSFNRVTIFTANFVTSSSGFASFAVPPPLFLKSGLQLFNVNQQLVLDLPISLDVVFDFIGQNQTNYWPSRIGNLRTVWECSAGGVYSQQQSYWGASLGGTQLNFAGGIYNSTGLRTMNFHLKNFGGGAANSTLIYTTGQTFDLSCASAAFICPPWWAQLASQDNFAKLNRAWGATVFMLENV